MYPKNLAIIICLSFLYFSCQPSLIVKRPAYNYDGMDSRTIEIHKSVEDFLFLVQASGYPVDVPSSTRIEKLLFSERDKRIDITLSEVFSERPFRQDNVSQIYTELRKTLGDEYRDFNIHIVTLNRTIEELIPNYYRPEKSSWDFSRQPDSTLTGPPAIVRKAANNFQIDHGLYGNNIALWHSHGWYYDGNRWKWQRARLFGTVEDLLPLAFTLPYLVPMLENAGANVFIPRERDTQIHEIIIDNDSANDSSMIHWSVADSVNWNKEDKGFSLRIPSYLENVNPFEMGTSLSARADNKETARIEWRPTFSEDGYYAVYISYKKDNNNCTDALYTVYHSAGKTSFKVNQQMGGATWIYLGKFKFKKGYHPHIGKVTLSNISAVKGAFINADAVKFGGGMGDILREGQESGRPKFTEGARYYMQDAGIPDTLVYKLNEHNDYKDDYQSRGEWVNYLNGAPNGPNRNRSLGLDIPIDASLAFHTDAGRTTNDTTVGTLQIYSISGTDSQDTFPDGMSRYASRDLSDIMQTQIVEDLRFLFDPAWTRRSLWERQYSEVTRTNIPSTLLELLSHHNFRDMQFALDPRFRFHSARAIYKALLRFVSSQQNRPCQVQPLPVDHFSAQFDSTSNIILNWQPVKDPLEASATALAYKVYTRLGDGGFDNGQIVNSNSFTLKIPREEIIYSFKVTAINGGGESFASEILSVCKMKNKAAPVLIINGFDRIAGPAKIENENFSGFLYEQDNGVPDGYDYHFTGEQFNFDSNDPWHNDDRPGHGASYADQETKIIAGNTFDFPFVHGQAIKNAGFSFISSSDEAITDGQFNLENFKIIDLILGEEQETHWPNTAMDSVKGTSFKTFPEKLKRAINSFLYRGNALFVSGAYIGSDLFKNRRPQHPDIIFAQNSLKFNWITDHAVKTGSVFTPVKSPLLLPAAFEFNTQYRADLYRVEAADAIGPYGGSKTILRYKENGMSAAIAYEGSYKVVASAIPFETILTEKDRTEIMFKILEFLKPKD